MTFKTCCICGEQKIVWDLDRVGSRADDKWKCLDNCFESYNKYVGIKLVAPDSTEEQKQRVIDSALDVCKSFGTAKEAAKALRHMSFKVDTNNPDVLIEGDLPTIGLGVEPTVGAGVPSRSYTREKAAKAAHQHHVAKSIGNYVGKLAEEFGFTKPEDGAEDRYRERSARQSSARHAFWWWLHNCVAHPLIGIVPRRAFFRFHDWTSRKLHGR